MKTRSMEATCGVDRLATSDEIRAAMALFSEGEVEDTEATILEIPSDGGGFVRIKGEDFELLSMIEETDQLVR